MLGLLEEVVAVIEVLEEVLGVLEENMWSLGRFYGFFWKFGGP